MKTVLFALNGSHSHTNLAIRAIGASLLREGMEVTLIERNLKDARLSVLSALYEERADVYGFSVYIWNATEIYRLGAELSLLLPEAKIVFGGPEVSFCDERFFADHPYVDHIIAGEGEDAFPALCRSLERGEAPPPIIEGSPFGDFPNSGIYYDEIGGEPHGLVYYESVRGCPFSCAYCLSAAERGIRAKTAEKALADLLLFEKFQDIRTVKLVDRTFNFDVERAKTIWRGLCGAEYTKEYHFEVSAALLDEEALQMLSEAPKGKFRLEIGVQSTNPETIKAIDRRLDTEKTLAVLERLHEKGNLHLHADLIAGLPHENLLSFGQSFDAVYGKADVLQLGFLKLLYGSPLRERAGRLGIKFSPEPPYRVLATKDIAFSELMLLEAIDGLNDRFSNSGRFRYSFPALPLASSSAFGFFERMTETAKVLFGTAEVARLSQSDAFLLALRTAEAAKIAEKTEAKARLALDFLLSEARQLPSFLRDVLLTGAEREAALADVPACRRSAFEAVRCTFLGGETVLADRVNKEITLKI